MVQRSRSRGTPEEPAMKQISRCAGRLIRLMDDAGKSRFTMIDSFVGEKPHAMVIVAVTPEHCAKIMKQLKKWLEYHRKTAPAVISDPTGLWTPMRAAIVTRRPITDFVQKKEAKRAKRKRGANPR
jgi:hypothetical protein